MISRKKYYMYVLIVIVIISTLIYYHNFSNNGILKNITRTDKYELVKEDENLIITLFIKPEWIPKELKDKHRVNELVYTSDDTKIVLDNIYDNSGDYVFSFKIKQNYNYNSGYFLHTQSFNEDGTFGLNGHVPNIFDIEKNKIELGTRGISSENEFSFGIRKTDYLKFKDGFYVGINCLTLYKYEKIK